MDPDPLRIPPDDLADLLRLIVITDGELASRHGGREPNGQSPVEVVVQEALQAGCRAIQLRMKGAGAREMLAAAIPLRRMTDEAGALLVVNNRLDVALAADADGVHLGPDDIPVGAAREAIRRVRRAARDGARGGRSVPNAAPGSRAMDEPRPFLVGYSTDDPEAARRAVAQGADYIGCGTVYATASKDDAGEVIGLKGLDAVAAAVDVPVVGIGGITPERAAAVARTRASGVAVISAVMGAEDPSTAVRTLLQPFE